MEENAHIGIWLSNNHGTVVIDGKTTGINRLNSGNYAGYKLSSTQVKIKLGNAEYVGRLSGTILLLGDDLRLMEIPFENLSDNAKIARLEKIETSLTSAQKKATKLQAEHDRIKASIS